MNREKAIEIASDWVNNLSENARESLSEHAALALVELIEKDVVDLTSALDWATSLPVETQSRLCRFDLEALVAMIDAHKPRAEGSAP